MGGEVDSPSMDTLGLIFSVTLGDHMCILEVLLQFPALSVIGPCVCLFGAGRHSSSTNVY